MPPVGYVTVPHDAISPAMLRYLLGIAQSSTEDVEYGMLSDNCVIVCKISHKQLECYKENKCYMVKSIRPPVIESSNHDNVAIERESEQPAAEQSFINSEITRTLNHEPYGPAVKVANQSLDVSLEMVNAQGVAHTCLNTALQLINTDLLDLMILHVIQVSDSEPVICCLDLAWEPVFLEVVIWPEQR